jgi:hypothetical protein
MDENQEINQPFLIAKKAATERKTEVRELPTDSLHMRIFQRIKELRSGVSFVELAQIDGFAGEHQMVLGADGTSNIILWSSVSLEAAAALRELMRAGKITIKPTLILTYLIDGCTLNLPVAKSTKRQYRKPRWLPVTFDLAAA